MIAEVFVELSEDADRLEVPWASPTEPSNRYRNLKAERALVEQLPEAVSCAPLKQFLLAANAPDSLFESAKCNVWETRELTAAEREAGFGPAKFGSYIDLFFALPALNFDPQHHENLAHQLKRRLERWERDQACVELCVRRCLYHAAEAWGYYLTAFVFGYGKSSAEAQANWAAALEALERSLQEIGAILRQAIAEADRHASP